MHFAVTSKNRSRTRVASMLVATLVSLSSMAASAAEPSSAEAKTLCGWFDNPTPGNAWLTDRSAEWIVGVQGGHQAEGDWPEFKAGQWISTNRSYGYGCACLRVVASAASHEVQRILSAKSRPLSACKKDPALARHRPDA